jgi:hypothetical protein
MKDCSTASPSDAQQVSPHGVPVHVVELLDELGLAPDVEIVETGLPELGQEVVCVSERKWALSGGLSVPSASFHRECS